MRPITKKFEFKGSGGVTLAGRLDVPVVGLPKAYAVFAHCFSCSKDLAASRNISSRLASEGFGVLRFDFTGLGHSQGEFANSHFKANVHDLLAAIDAMSDASVVKVYGEAMYGQRPVPSLGGGPGYGAEADDVWSLDTDILEQIQLDGVVLPVLDTGPSHGEKARAGAF